LFLLFLKNPRIGFLAALSQPPCNVVHILGSAELVAHAENPSLSRHRLSMGDLRQYRHLPGTNPKIVQDELGAGKSNRGSCGEMAGGPCARRCGGQGKLSARR
jgi:hypothetical protein